MKIDPEFMRLLVSIFLIFIFYSSLKAQSRVDTIRMQLESVLVENPGLQEDVDLSVENLELHSFLRGLGVNHDLNLNIQPDLVDSITNSFSKITVLDVIVFLAEQYDLDLEISGGILNIKKLEIAPKEYIPRIPDISIDTNRLFTFDLRADTLSKVVEQITKISDENVITTTEVENYTVSVFIKNKRLDEALKMIAYSNRLKVTRDSSGFFILDSLKSFRADENPDIIQNRRATNRSVTVPPPPFDTNQQIKVTVHDDDLVSVEAYDAEVDLVVREIAENLGKNFLFLDDTDGKADLLVDNVNFEEILEYVLSGTNCTFLVQDDVYLIGLENKDILRTTELVRLNYRAIENVLPALPPDLLTDLTISEFIELNSFVVRGSYKRVQVLKSFLTEIDQPVPSVLIEVLIVDYNKSRSTTAGISAGVGDGPQTSGGTITPSVNYSMNSVTINDLINGFNGFGLINLGQVTPNFYMSIEALETDGVLNTRSTPKLATTNGREATLSIGRTEYYLEETSRFVGTQNPALEVQQNFRAVNADLSITIRPIVSGKDEVTLIIGVQQSDFTERISDTAPPGSVTRDFQSQLRIKNGDMVLLGGLESKAINKSGRGLPLIARLPILKWIFGRRTEGKANSKLNLFIKATVIH